MTIAGTIDCGCHVGPWWGVTPPPTCAMHGGPSSAVLRTFPSSGTLIPVGVIDYGQPQQSPTEQHTHYHFARSALLSDDDVERIAQRIVELLREPPKP